MRRRSPVAAMAALLALPAAAAPAAAEDAALAALLAVPGDAAFGAYLAGECTSCHQPGAANDGVPPIAGRPPEDFARALHDYRTGARAHAIMNMLAARLGDEEIAALAAHFATLR